MLCLGQQGLSKQGSSGISTLIFSAHPGSPKVLTQGKARSTQTLLLYASVSPELLFPGYKSLLKVLELISS